MCPERVTERGFYHGAEHRIGLTSAYNQYTRCSWDSYYSPATENLQILLKPLFLTSSMLADFLQTSSSSVPLDSCFPARRAKPPMAPLFAWVIIRVWSGSRSPPPATKLLSKRLVVMSERCLTRNWQACPMTVRRCTWTFPATSIYATGCTSILPGSWFTAASPDRHKVPMRGRLTAIAGPQPVFFFAPIQILKRNADWGPEGVSEHIGAGLQRFYRQLTATDKPLLEVVERQRL